MAKTNSTQTAFVIQIADEHKSTVIGFNNSAAPLEGRSDLSLLMDMALESNDPTICQVFKAMPTPEQWQAYKTALFENNQPE